MVPDALPLRTNALRSSCDGNDVHGGHGLRQMHAEQRLTEVRVGDSDDDAVDFNRAADKLDRDAYGRSPVRLGDGSQ